MHSMSFGRRRLRLYSVAHFACAAALVAVPAQAEVPSLDAGSSRPADPRSVTPGLRLAQLNAPQSELIAVPKAVAETLSSMLQAMSARDVAGLDRLLARSVDPEIIYYWGETVKGRSTILQWHSEWFAEKGWTIEPGSVTHSLVDSRVAVVSSTLRYVKSAERQFRILVNHELVKESSGWKIARIQQTLLEGPQ